MKPATAGGPYKVPRQHDSWRSITLAVAMHAVLLFLWVGVSWQNNDPVEVQAEIWDMKVQEAAPRRRLNQPRNLSRNRKWSRRRRRRRWKRRLCRRKIRKSPCSA
jgi:hypothetical protein